MIKFLLILLLFTPSFAFSKVYLFVKVKYCINSDLTATSQSIQVFKNGNFEQSLTDSLKGQTFVIFKNIDTGRYQFRYKNQFDFDVQESIHISSDGTYELNICIDKLRDRDQGFRGLVDSITFQNPLYIKVNTGGCFANSNSVLKIYKNGNKYYASYQMQIENQYGKVKREKKVKKLTNVDILTIREFEYDFTHLKYVYINSCIKIVSTSKAEYTITQGKIVKRILAENNEWKNIGWLTKKLF